MLLSAVSVLVVAQSSSEIPEGLTNNPVYNCHYRCVLHVIENLIIFVNSENMFKINVTIFRLACIHLFPDRSCIVKSLRISLPQSV